MNQATVRIKKIIKQSELSDWKIELSVDSEETLTVPIRDKGPIYIASTLASLPEALRFVPKRYPFQYNMLHVSDASAREAYVEVLDNTPVSADISLTAYKYIVNNIKQTNWVPDTTSLRHMIDMSTGQTLGAVNENAIMAFSEYEALNPDKNMNRFWFILESPKVEVLSGDSIRSYISGYAWPQAVAVPEEYDGFDFKSNHLALDIKYLGVKDVYNHLGKENFPEKYQLPAKDLEKIQEEAKNFNELLVKNSPILAVSLQYNYLTKSFKKARDTRALEAVVYGTKYNNVQQALDAIQSSSFEGFNLNKEMLTPMYSEFKKLLLENRNSQPMPIALYDGIKEVTKGDVIDVSKWEKELSLYNNPIQYSSVSALINGEPMNTIDYSAPLTVGKIKQIAKQAYDKIQSYNKNSDSTMIHVLNQPLGDGPQPADESEDSTEDEGSQDTAATFTRMTPEDADISSIESYQRDIFLNNDNPVNPFDDRLFTGEIYSKSEAGKTELPWDYVNKVRIGDVFLPIPPTAIRMDRQYTTKKVETMRAKTSLQTGVGNTRNIITLDIYYATLEDVNGKKRRGPGGKYYYMDGLRPLIAQFKKAPFLPIDNEYINLSLKVHNVVLRNLQVQTVPGFPEALKATLILEEFDLQPYIIGETQLGSLINYPLLRFHYQRSLHRVDEFDEAYKTYLPEIEELSNDFTISLVDENDLINRASLGRAIRSLLTPTEYRIKREKELQGEEIEDDNYSSSGPPEQSISDSIDSIEKDYESILRVKEQYRKLMREFESQTIAREFGLEGRYSDPGLIPVIPGGYTNKEWELSSNEVRYGHRMAIELYGRGTAIWDPSYEASIIPNPTSWDSRAWNSTSSSMFMPRDLISNHYKPWVEETDIPYATFLPAYRDEIEKYSGRKNVGDLEFEHVRRTNGAGWYVILPEADVTRESFRKRIESVAGDHAGATSTGSTPEKFVIRAGYAEYEAVLNDVLSDLRGYTEDVSNYEEEYKKLIGDLNTSEENLRMVDQYIPDIIPSSLTVSLENTFSSQQVQTAETPTMQYFGSSDPEVLVTFETTDAGVAALESVLRKVAFYTKNYREGIVSGFLGIENNLVNMFGINDIIPTSVQYDTIEGHPERRLVTLVASSFDKTQRRLEGFYSYTGGEIESNMEERLYRGYYTDADGNRIYKGYNPAQDHRFVHRYLAQLELYPDLEMPMVKELDALLPEIGSTQFNRWPNRTNQLYLDPDFYVATNQTFKKVINDSLHGFASDDQELRTEDTTGYVTDNKLKAQSVTNFVEVGESAGKFEEDGEEAYFADSGLMWENYGNEHKFQPIIIGVTHGNLGGGGGSGVIAGGGAPPDSYGSSGTVADMNLDLTDLNIQVDILSSNGSQTGGKGNTLQGIILHDTGNTAPGADAQMHHNYQRNGAGGRQASWHYSVDDNVAIQSFSHDEICWHAG